MASWNESLPCFTLHDAVIIRLHFFPCRSHMTRLRRSYSSWPALVFRSQTSRESGWTFTDGRDYRTWLGLGNAGEDMLAFWLMLVPLSQASLIRAVVVMAEDVAGVTVAIRRQFKLMIRDG